jgi:tetratricopeptide (TPR) repeat protein
MKKISQFISAITPVILILCMISNTYASNDFDVYIARGIDKINEKQFSEALEVLQKALELEPDDTEALYYTALAYTRLGELEKAEKLFLKIRDKDSNPGINFELGRIYYVNEDCVKAEDYLSKFISLTDDESLKKYASTLIKDCYGSKEAQKEERPYNLYVTLGSQYDDNVIVEPNNPDPSVSRDDKDDGVAVAFIAADAVVLDKGVLKLNAEYNFYQSVHLFDMSNYDVHYHKISPVLEIKLHDAFMPSIGYSYEYTALGEEFYSESSSYFAGFKTKKSDNLSTDLTYKYSDLRYRDTELFIDNSVRSGYKSDIGIKLNFSVDKLRGDVHYSREYVRAKADYWAYDGQRAGAELMINIVPKLYLTVFGEYNENRYREDFPGELKKRKDEMMHYSLTLTYQISDRFTAYLSEDYSDNDSNLTDFDYTRNIVSLFLTMSVF